MASRSVRPPSPPKIGRTRLLPPPKAPPLKPTRVVGENGRILAPSKLKKAASMAARWPASSGRFNMASAISSRTGMGSGTNRLGNHDGVGGMKANRRVEVEQAAKIGRSDQDLGFGGLDIGLAPGELGGGSIRVGGPA